MKLNFCLLVSVAFLGLSCKTSEIPAVLKDMLRALSEECLETSSGLPCLETKEKGQLIQKLQMSEARFTEFCSREGTKDTLVIAELQYEIDSLKAIKSASNSSKIQHQISACAFVRDVLEQRANDSIFMSLLAKEYENPVAVHNCKSLESYAHYRIWYMELLKHSGKVQPSRMSQSQAITYYNLVVRLSEYPFVDLNHEKELLERIERFTHNATDSNLIRMSFSECFVDVLEVRLNKIQTTYNNNCKSPFPEQKEKVFFETLESWILKGLALNPDHYGLNYNLGTLYVNRSVYFISNQNESLSASENERLDRLAQVYTEKSQNQLKKAETLFQEQKRKRLEGKK